jgi:hypothetical protein
MKSTRTMSVVLATLLLSVAAVAQAQGLTREQVKMDRDTFLSMFRWSDTSSEWVLKSGMAPPKGVATREEVVGMRDKFLSMNRWDETSSQFVPIKAAPREMSKLSRDQVKKETTMFLKMHRFDEGTSQWVLKTSAAK